MKRQNLPPKESPYTRLTFSILQGHADYLRMRAAVERRDVAVVLRMILEDEIERTTIPAAEPTP